MRTGGIKRIVVGGIATAALVGALGAGAMAASNGSAASKQTPVTKVHSSDATEVRHEAEPRGRVAEGEIEAGDVQGREMEPGDDQGQREAEPADDRGQGQEAGDDNGTNSGPSVNAGPGSTDDRSGHDAGDDRGSI